MSLLFSVTQNSTLTLKSITVISLFLSDITISDSYTIPDEYNKYYDNSTSIRSYKISIQNAKIVNLTNVIVQNISLADTTFFDLQNAIQQDYIQLLNVTFLNSSFYNTTILSLNIKDQYQKIEFSNIQFINCNLTESSFFMSEEFQYQGVFKIQNLKIQNCTLSQSLFIKFPICDYVEIINTSILNNVFLDSTLFTLSTTSLIQAMLISSTSIENSQIILKGKYSLSSVAESFELSDFQFVNVLYTQSNFINIHQHGNESIKIYLSNIEAQGLQLFADIDWLSQTNDLYTFEGSEIFINNLKLFRNPGARDFLIQNFDKVSINNVFVSSNISEKDLQQKETTIDSLNTIFYINSLFTEIINCEIQNQLAIDTIFIVIANNDIVQFSNKIIIEDFKVSKSKLIKKTYQYISTIFQISSTQNQNTSFSNCIFTNIWLNDYVQDPEISSAAVIVIQTELGNVYFTSILVSNVIITNSSNSIMLIESNTFEMDNITSLNVNNIAFYSKEYNDQYDVLNIINSQGGLMHLIIQKFDLKNSQFVNSTGLQGGVFYIITKFFGIIEITNSFFINSSTSFINSNQGQGGCFFIDSSNSYLSLNIDWVNFQNSSSGNSGGVLQFKETQHKSLIELTNINFVDSFSYFYPIFDFQYQFSNSILSTIYLNNIVIQNEWSNFFIFINNYQLTFDSIQDSAMFSSSGCQIKIENISFTGVSIYKLLSFNYIQQLILKDITINQLNQFTQQLFSLQNNEGKNIIQLEISSSLKIFNVKFINITSDSDVVTFNGFNQFLIQLSLQSQISFIRIIANENIRSVFLSDIQIISNNCLYCNQGLISLINYQNQTKLQITNLLLLNNHCGNGACMYLKSSDQNLMHSIWESKFLNNFAQQGGGLQSEHMSLAIKRSYFLKNSVKKNGGAILYENDQCELLLNQIFIIQNTAEKGGGMMNQNIQNISNLQSVFFLENQAINYGNNLVTVPYKLQTELNKSIIRQDVKLINNNIIEIVGYSIIRQSQQFIYLPSGISLNLYEKFSFETLSYKDQSQSFTVKAYNFLDEHMHELNSTYCKLSPRQIFMNENGSKTENQQTNKTVVYENELNLYDIGELIFVLDPYKNDSEYLEVDITCNSINREDYYLRFFLKTFYCQIGEYYSDNQCLKCDFEKGYYSVAVKSTSCTRIDISKLRNTTGTMLELQNEYWRYSYRSDIIIQCSKYPSRCLGGWNVSDETCIQGAIGALCEECDLFDVRGQGSFINQQKEQCSICGEYSYQAFFSFLESLWVVMLTYLTVRSTHFSNKQLFKFKCLYKNFNALYKSTIDQTSILIKMINNVFQILMISYTFQIHIFDYLSIFVLFLGDSTYMTSYQIDCSTSKITTTNFEYTHFIILIILPFIHFSICCFVYLILVAKKIVNFTKAYLYSSIIYLYCFNQQHIIKWYKNYQFIGEYH